MLKLYKTGRSIEEEDREPITAEKLQLNRLGSPEPRNRGAKYASRENIFWISGMADTCIEWLRREEDTYFNSADCNVTVQGVTRPLPSLRVRRPPHSTRYSRRYIKYTSLDVPPAPHWPVRFKDWVFGRQRFYTSDLDISVVSRGCSQAFIL